MMSILRPAAVPGLPVLIAGSFCCMSLASSEEPVSFKDSGQKLGDTMSFSVALGDLDGDGDLDAWVANDQANLVWINDGNGLFTDSGQALGKNRSLSVALGTLDGEQALDAWVANGWGVLTGPQPDRVWTNDGNGSFSDSGQALGKSQGFSVALGDVDGDGDLDAWVANGPYAGLNQPQNTVWFNDGAGIFTDSGQALGDRFSYSVALGDLDGDGDLDAWVANAFQPNTIWTNDGSGTFIDSGQRLGSAQSSKVVLGDLDGDGDLDAWVANIAQPNAIWTNDGTGTFTDSGQKLGKRKSRSVALADLDDDGDLDAWVANVGGSDTVWLNNGSGTFTDSGLKLATGESVSVALGDLDGDGDLDAWIANLGAPDTVWLNERTSNGPQDDSDRSDAD